MSQVKIFGNNKVHRASKLALGLILMAYLIPLAARPAEATLLLRAGFQDAALSVDGATSVEANTPLQSDTPAGATIVKAYLYVADVFGGGSAGNVTLNGQFLAVASGTLLTPNANPANTRVFDVTTNVATAINTAGGGLVTHTYSESGSSDGAVLVVVYANASTVGGTAIILDGELALAGDTTTLNFASPYSGGNVLMSLADSFSFNGSTTSNFSGQVSLVDVTTTSTINRRLTSCAGGNDDGNFTNSNGTLITAGGIGDSPSNPAPNCAGGAGDDEFYNLALGNSANASPFLNAGDTFLQFKTSNPSFDDNIFGLFFTSAFRITNVDDTPIEPPVIPAPEPTSLALISLGLAAIAGRRFARRKDR